MRKKLIPEVPDPLVLTEELENKLRGWIDYFKNMSKRIIVKTPHDEDFDLTMYENACKLCFGYSDNPEDILLYDWPNKNQIAFIVCHNSATPGNKPQYLAEHAVIFCFGEFAFMLGANSFEQGERTPIKDGKYQMEYYLCGSANLLTWEFNKGFIKDRLIDIENSVPKVPVS